MKKTIILIAALAAALSCTKEIQSDIEPGKVEDNTVPMSFSVSCDDNTKAFLNADRTVSFAAGDRISIFAGGNNYEFTTEEGGLNAVFTGSAEVAETYYALYPYSADATIDGGVIRNVTISQSTVGTGTGTFNSQKAVMVAVSTTNSLKFKQVTALLKITVPEDITDLKEVIVFNRDNGSSNTAGAITGTFDVTPALDGAPVINVTDPKFQTGFVGPSGSSSPVPAGDYYLPVLPAQLTAKKGIDLKLTFMDSFVGRAFNGRGLKLERANVYNLGTVKKTTDFVFDGFESGSAISGDDYTGNTNALSVVENPFKTTVNGSNYVLKNDMSGSTGGTSGYIQVKTASDNGYTKFPSAVRSNYDKIRVKMYLGTNAYYPRARRGSDAAVRPALLNGVSFDTEAAWNAAVKTNDWNVLEWNISQLVSSWTNMSNMQTIEFRPFVNWDGSNVSGFDEITNNRLIYVDDFTFVLK